jgi:hypothetical protein
MTNRLREWTLPTVLGVISLVLGFTLAQLGLFSAASDLTAQQFTPTGTIYSVKALLNDDIRTLQFGGEKNRCLTLIVQSSDEDVEVLSELTSPSGSTLLRGTAVRNKFDVVLPEKGKYLIKIGEEGGELPEVGIDVSVGKCP